MDAVSTSSFWMSLAQVIWIDIALSGDNALVIAMACRRLPPRYRRIGVFFGTGCAVVLRVVFAGLVLSFFEYPYVKLIGALFLLWIAVKLVLPQEEEEAFPQESHGGEGMFSEEGGLRFSQIFDVVRTVVIADAVMSLDNVISVAAAARGDFFLLVIGIGISIPLMVVGSSVMLWVLDRFPATLILGGWLLGWISGRLLTHDPLVAGYLSPFWISWGLPFICALGVGVFGVLYRKMGKGAGWGV